MESELELRKFVVPEFIFGFGALKLAGRYAKNLGASRILVVTDPGVMAAGWTDQAAASSIVPRGSASSSPIRNTSWSLRGLIGSPFLCRR
jgi:hypothetical protein